MQRPANLKIRTISAIIFGILVIGTLLAGPLAFVSLMFLATLIGLSEFYRMGVTIHGRPLGYAGLAAGAAVYLLITYSSFEAGYASLYLVMLFIIPVALIIFWLFSHDQTDFLRVAYLIMGIIYIAIPLALLASLFSFHPFFPFETKGMLIIGFFTIVWTFDTGAYFIGSFIGRHKLYEKISPKKTWEGTIGGFVFAMLAAWLLSVFTALHDIAFWFIVTGIISVFGTLGDLAESKMKRQTGIKDSGSLMPGHGGVLDRFDAVLMSVPFVYVYVILYTQP